MWFATDRSKHGVARDALAGGIPKSMMSQFVCYITYEDDESGLRILRVQQSSGTWRWVYH